MHVTMSLANEPGKLDRVPRDPGPDRARARREGRDAARSASSCPRGRSRGRIGASQPYYRAASAVREARAAGVYLIGRVVVFEDPTLTAARPDLAIQHSDGSVWVNNAGLGWANPYDKRVWKYVVGIGEAAARAGFDEIQFDYVRFPSDGPIETAVFPGRPPSRWAGRSRAFAHYAASRLHPLGVRVSVDVFGLLGDARPRDRPGAQAAWRSTSTLSTRWSTRRTTARASSTCPTRARRQGRPSPSRSGTSRTRCSARKALLIPWLEDFSLTSPHPAPADVQAQIDAARRARTRGSSCGTLRASTRSKPSSRLKAQANRRGGTSK